MAKKKTSGDEKTKRKKSVKGDARAEEGATANRDANFLDDEATAEEYDESRILVEQAKAQEFMQEDEINANYDAFDPAREQASAAQFANNLYPEQFFFSDMFGDDDDPEDGTFDDEFDQEFEKLPDAEFEEIFQDEDEDGEPDEDEIDALEDEDFDSMNSEENIYEDDDM